MRDRLHALNKRQLPVWLYGLLLPFTFSITMGLLSWLVPIHLTFDTVVIFLLSAILLYLLTVLINVSSEKRHLETRATLSLNKLQAFLEQNPDAVGIYDTTGHLRKVNRRLEELYGISREHLIGRHFSTMPFIPQHLHAELNQLLHQAAHGVTTTSYRTTRVTSNDSDIHILLSIFPMMDDNGEVFRCGVIARDICTQMKMEQQLLESEKLAAVGTLAAGVAHEIRNPLTAILGFVKLMPVSTPEQQKSYVSIIQTELNRISTIVTDMLSLAKPSTVDYGPVEMLPFIQGVYKFLESEALMRDVELVLDVSSLDTLRVLGSADQLRQVFINLVRNAMDALTNSNRKVCISANGYHSTLAIRIRDTGVGLSDEQLQKISDPFYTTKQNGTGLGLYICRRIVTQHHGKMTFESGVGNGTVVHLAFPIFT